MLKPINLTSLVHCVEALVHGVVNRIVGLSNASNDLVHCDHVAIAKSNRIEKFFASVSYNALFRTEINALL